MVLPILCTLLQSFQWRISTQIPKTLVGGSPRGLPRCEMGWQTFRMLASLAGFLEKVALLFSHFLVPHKLLGKLPGKT